MWTTGWRDGIWSDLDQKWDLIVIGGGITGAGILREATRAGLRTLLVEAQDFASGTSSRSSKLVHGGFRYLKNAQLKMTYESVRERERLLREGRGLINQLGFVIACNQEDQFPSWLYGIGLILYDLIAVRWSHKYYDEERIKDLCPQLKMRGLVGGYRYIDALTDDARLVFRIIREAVRDGGVAINYARVEGFLFDWNQNVHGIILKDLDPDRNGRTTEVIARMVVNATGAWADGLIPHKESNLASDRSASDKMVSHRRLRKLRGSHLIFPWERIPLTRAVSILHPVDHRPVFTFPWEGVTIIGTTDVDHGSDVGSEPSISEAEVDYLLQAVQRSFPDQNLDAEDVRATFSGIRAVVDTGKKDPSKESREHVLWYENGLLTITGGKLTTFRLMAVTTLRFLNKKCSIDFVFDPDEPILETPDKVYPPEYDLDRLVHLRLMGRFGPEYPCFLETARRNELESVPLSPVLWSELRWAARCEGVLHLDDLLLRRVRLGLTLPEGGIPWMEKIREIAQVELCWNDERWNREVVDYRRRYASNYSIGTSI